MTGFEVCLQQSRNVPHQGMVMGEQQEFTWSLPCVDLINTTNYAPETLDINRFQWDLFVAYYKTSHINVKFTVNIGHKALIVNN